jgi:hypothetical protein
MSSSQRILQNEKTAGATVIARSGKFKPACDRTVAASRYVFNSAAAVITRMNDGGNVVQYPLTLVN